MIALACLGFVIVLGLAAYWDRSIVALHAFQSSQYVAIVILAAHRNRWAYFLGIAVASFWNYLTLFVNNFVLSGFRALETSIATGVLTRPDQIIAVFGFAFHLVLIVACVIAYLRLSGRSAADWGRLLVSLLGAVAYFAAIVALLQPRYLPMFPKLLHPHGLA
jgi:hypothetical protein